MFGKKVHNLIVFYRHADNEKPTQIWGFGNCDATIVGSAIPSMEQIRGLEKDIQKKYELNNVVITGWEKIRV